ncbi:MAG: hypothetical protein IKN53_01265 [Oscillibacter sp.]|nr:hypothetical protein [Oscillibacter sp.]
MERAVEDGKSKETPAKYVKTGNTSRCARKLPPQGEEAGKCGKNSKLRVG